MPAFPCSSETRSRRVDVSTTRLLTYSTSTTRRRRTSHGAGRRSRNTATQAVIRQHVHLDEPRGRARRHGAHGVDGVSRGGSLAMASGAEGRLPRPLAPKFGTGSGLVRRLLGRFRPGAQSRSQNRTRAPVGRFDGQPRGGVFEALAVDAINEVVLSWRGPRRTKLLDLVHGKTMPCFPHRVEMATTSNVTSACRGTPPREHQ